MALGLTQTLKEMSTRNISWGKMRPVRRANNLTTFMCWLFWNLGTSTSWNPLSRSVMGLLYLTAHSYSNYWPQRSQYTHKRQLFVFYVQI